MALPTTREELKQYCLRKLGASVLEINVSDQQLEDRIDEALMVFQDYHFDGVEEYYLKHLTTASTATFASALTEDFIVGEIVTGGTSEATGIVVDQAENNLSIRLKFITDTFEDGEVLTGSNSGTTGTLASSNGVVLGDIDNGYIDVGEQVLSVMDIMPASFLGRSMFDFRYQTMLHYVHDFGSTDMISYSMVRQHFALIQDLFGSAHNQYRFNRKQDRLYIDWDWKYDISVDEYILIKCLRTVDPATYPEIYKDYFLIQYVTALFKQQWGTNLKKFSGIQLPGGGELNGQQIYDEATTEIERLDEKLRLEFQEPVGFLVG